MPKKKETETQKYRSQELERRRRMVLSMQRKVDKLAAAVKILSKRKFKSTRAKNNQLTRICQLMIRIRIIQSQVLMVIYQPIHKLPPGLSGAAPHGIFGKEIIHTSLEGEKVIAPDNKSFIIPKATMTDLPGPELIQTILNSVNNVERIFPKFKNLGKTDEEAY